MSKTNDKMIHDKAIRLLEGGIVEVDGLFVRAIKSDFWFEACDLCEMDCLCHSGTEMIDVCKECDSIDVDYVYLKLVN